SEGIPAWDSLTADQKRVYARMMEVYAATVAQSDHEVGRILDSLQESGQLDNTLVIYLMGDNGASAEGTMQGTTSEEVVLTDGRVVRVAPGFDAATLQQLLAVLEGRPC